VTKIRHCASGTTREHALVERQLPSVPGAGQARKGRVGPAWRPIWCTVERRSSTLAGWLASNLLQVARPDPMPCSCQAMPGLCPPVKKHGRWVRRRGSRRMGNRLPPASALCGAPKFPRPRIEYWICGPPEDSRLLVQAKQSRAEQSRARSRQALLDLHRQLHSGGSSPVRWSRCRCRCRCSVTSGPL
jgi:hypothetical protein